MTDELHELYQELIMEHNHKPRNFRKLVKPNRSADGFNPLCGDSITLEVEMKDDHIEDIAFQGSGCAISKASASLMTEMTKGKSKEEAEKLFEAFHAMVTRKPGEGYNANLLGELEGLAGVVEFPMRVKCATLAWHTLRAALNKKKGTATTE